MFVYGSVYIHTHLHQLTILAGKHIEALSKDTITEQSICCCAAFQPHLFSPLQEMTSIGQGSCNVDTLKKKVACVICLFAMFSITDLTIPVMSLVISGESMLVQEQEGHWRFTLRRSCRGRSLTKHCILEKEMKTVTILRRAGETEASSSMSSSRQQERCYTLIGRYSCCTYVLLCLFYLDY